MLLPYCVSVVRLYCIPCYREIFSDSTAGQENPFEPLDHLEEESGCITLVAVFSQAPSMFAFMQEVDVYFINYPGAGAT